MTKCVQTSDEDPTPSFEQEQRSCALLVNIKSGGRNGANVAALFESWGCVAIPLLETVDASPSRNAWFETLGTIIGNGGFVIIAGGDGTSAWGVETIEKCCKQHNLEFPYVVLYPLGSGNDLSRSLGWGNKQPALKRAAVQTLLKKYRKSLDDGVVSVLDRWGINWTFTDSTNTNTCWGRPLPKTFLCYVSIGYCARISHEFEIDRQNSEESFNNISKNQLVYVYHGVKEFFSPMKPLTSDDVRLWIDGKEVKIPPGTRSLKILNINSAMNGLFCWGTGASTSDELQDWELPRLDDGLFEVVSTGGVHDMIGQRMNYGHARRIAQTKHVVWELVREMEIQIDGEAWIQKPCKMEFFLKDQIPVAIGNFGCRGVKSEVFETGNKEPPSEVTIRKKQWLTRLKMSLDFSRFLPTKLHIGKQTAI